MNRTDHRRPVPSAELALWWYLPLGKAPFPVIVMAHGFAAVKELYLGPSPSASSTPALLSLSSIIAALEPAAGSRVRKPIPFCRPATTVTSSPGWQTGPRSIISASASGAPATAAAMCCRSAGPTGVCAASYRRFPPSAASSRPGAASPPANWRPSTPCTPRNANASRVANRRYCAPSFPRRVVGGRLGCARSHRLLWRGTAHRSHLAQRGDTKLAGLVGRI